MATEDYFKDLKKLKYAEEHKLVSELINKNDWINNPDISQNASLIVENCRKDRNKTRLDSFFLEYGLSNQEGVALMCLAESLLRIPDNQTCDEIIEEHKQRREERANELYKLGDPHPDEIRQNGGNTSEFNQKVNY